MEAKLIKIFLQTTAEWGGTTKQKLQSLAVQDKHLS